MPAFSKPDTAFGDFMERTYPKQDFMEVLSQIDKRLKKG